MSKYQIIVLGTPFRLEELRQSLKEYSDILFDNDPAEGSTLVLHLYYADSEKDKDPDRTAAVNYEKWSRALSIIPVVKNVIDCRRFIPESLKNINALQLQDDDSIDILKNYILGYFGLIDARRKVFISYKREDCEDLAHTLFNEFSRAHFIPFLDTYSISPGTDFQHHLEQELSNSDIFLCINSNNYLESKWCMKELKISTELGMAIVQLHFSESRIPKEAGFSKVVEMGQLDHNLSRYQTMIPHIIKTAEESLANGFEMKRRHIASLIDSEYKAFDSTIKYSEEKKEVHYLMNRIPDSFDLQTAQEKIEQAGIRFCDRKYVTFIGTYRLPEIKRHHEWLNKTDVPVKFKAI